MKNLVSVSPLRIVRKSASGMAVLCYTQDEWNRYQIGLGIRVSRPSLFINGIWLPLSQVVIKEGKVVALPLWLVKKNKLDRCENGAW